MAQGAERPFNTGEYTPGDSIAREPQTPAEGVAASGARLIGIIGSIPLRDVNMLARTGGSIGMIREYLVAKNVFEDALRNLAVEHENWDAYNLLGEESMAHIKVGMMLADDSQPIGP